MNSRERAWMSGPRPVRRMGLKGPQAARALAELDLSVPRAPNSWAPLTGTDRDGSWNVVGRLGHSEFFIEECGDAPGIVALESLTARGYPGAWPVLREDHAMVLGGAAAAEVLAEVCNVNFSALPGRYPLVMTLMIGVGVLLLPQLTDQEGPVHRIWCDPSYGPYLESQLEQIVTRISTGRAL